MENRVCQINAETISNANLRALYSTKYPVLMVIPKGSKIFVEFDKRYESDLPKPGSVWYRATYNGKIGYLCDITFKKLILDVEPERQTPKNQQLEETIELPEVAVSGYSSCSERVSSDDVRFVITTPDNANMRSAASVNSSTETTVPRGTILPFDKASKIDLGPKEKFPRWYKFNYNQKSGYLCDVTFVADLSPVCTGFVNPKGVCAQLIAAFNADADARRIFNEVHYYPKDAHITIGFGHFAGGTQDEFIRSMMSNAHMKKVLMGEFEKQFLQNKGFIDQARAEGFDLKLSSSNEVAGLENFLNVLKLEKEFVQASKAGKFPGGAKKTGYWLNDILVEVLLNKDICAWQVKFWLEHTLKDAKDFAVELGCGDHYGLVASLASLRSSGLMDRKDIKKLVWRNDVKPTSSSEKDAAAMRVWAYYNVAKKADKTRGRQKAIFSLWFAKSWTAVKHETCPTSIDDFKYNGTAMATASNGVAFELTTDDPYLKIISSFGSR
ncbi:MAG: hypothetical protein MJZ25_03300 [Fibrobacter sp.]|nr:hypothetical protein [Fibrobacter sp.]